jgi:hypothetical protein
LLEAINPYAFKWHIVKAKSMSDLKFDFEFSNPEIISMYAPDKMRITFLRQQELLAIDSRESVIFEP